MGKTPTVVKDEHNLKGYYENFHILNFNVKLLNDISADLFGDKLTGSQIERTLAYKPDLEKIMISEFDESVFVIKDPRLAVLSELYLSVLEHAKIIVLKRDSESVANSMCKMFGFPKEKSFEQFTKFYKLIDEIVPKRQFIQVSFEELVNDPKNTMKYVCDFMGIEFNPTVIDLIDKALIHA